MRRSCAVAMILILSGCAGSAPELDAETVQLRLPGFTATAPAARGWILAPGTAEAQAAVRSMGDTRTLVAFASEEDLRDLSGADTEGALDRAVQEVRTSYEGGRHRLRSFEEEEAGQGCRGYRVTAEDTGVPDLAGRLYVLTARGKVCLIAARSLLARVEYSDRRVEDKPPLPSFEQEAEAFLDSLFVPGV
jgi:hypothetical protein